MGILNEKNHIIYFLKITLLENNVFWKWYYVKLLKENIFMGYLIVTFLK